LARLKRIEGSTPPMAKSVRAKTPPQPPYIDRGKPLPPSYGENRIVALVRSPEQIHLCWDVETEVRVAGSPQVIRVRDLTAKRAYDLEPPADADNWYLRAAPNRTYRFELFERRGARLRRLATSKEVTTPVRRAGESAESVPSEIIQAMRHPISRGAGAAVKGARARLGGRRGAPAEVGAAAQRAPRAATTAAPEDARPGMRASRADQASEAVMTASAKDAPPAPIPAPWERVFAGDYAAGK
jgi:hypothetical protein